MEMVKQLSALNYEKYFQVLKNIHLPKLNYFTIIHTDSNCYRGPQLQVGENIWSSSNQYLLTL